MYFAKKVGEKKGETSKIVVVVLNIIVAQNITSINHDCQTLSSGAMAMAPRAVVPGTLGFLFFFYIYVIYFSSHQVPFLTIFARGYC